MAVTEPVPNQLSAKEIKQRKLDEIKRIVASRIKPEWQEQGVPRDQAIIDQQLETAARDVVDLTAGETRNRMQNPYPGELTGADERWYITQSLTLDNYHSHRAITDSWGSYLSHDPEMQVMFNSGDKDFNRWGISISHDNQKYPGLVKEGGKLAQMFQDCGFPLTPETRQTYLSPPVVKASVK